MSLRDDPVPVYSGPIGEGATTLDYLYALHPWLRTLIGDLESRIDELNTLNCSLSDDVGILLTGHDKDSATIKQLRQRNHAQRKELRRLNQAMINKNYLLQKRGGEALEAMQMAIDITDALASGQVTFSPDKDPERAMLQAEAVIDDYLNSELFRG